MLVAPVLIVLAGLGAPSAHADRLTDDRLVAASKQKRNCHAGLASGAGVVRRQVSVDEPSLVQARLRGKRGDWDLAMFGTDGRLRGASAALGSRELAEGFAPAGRLTVQACRRTGRARSVRLTVDAVALPRDRDGRRTLVKLVRVNTPTRAHKERLQSLGMDLTEHAGPTHVDVVAYGARDLAKLRSADLTFDVRIADLAANDARNRRRDAAYSRLVRRSNLPSGRDGYRRLADYEAELRMLAQRHPALVKLIELPHRSRMGRQILGIEITSNVKQADGKPVFMQIGLHHAREWPSGEHAMEWAYELIEGFNAGDPAIRPLVERTRTVIVPVQNPDGFNLSREASVDLRLLNEVNAGAGLLAAIIFDEETGFFAYKRRNCRMLDEHGREHAAELCGNGSHRKLGTDTNRNYGGFWGGPGAGTDARSETFRGSEPFSEPEVKNIREVVSSRQVTTLITNHTFSNLVLRPPGVLSEGESPDEGAYKRLAELMAGKNGYTSQYGYELYDTTGTTEDWSYYATGGFGFTFEIGPEEFHPPFEDVVAEYEGTTETAGGNGGNRAAYLEAQKSTAEAANHSVLTGSAPRGATLRLTKSFETPTSPVTGNRGELDRPLTIPETLSSVMEVDSDRRFEWHVNPSRRPYAMKSRSYPLLDTTPAETHEFKPVVHAAGHEQPITIDGQEVGGQIRAFIDVQDRDDYDLHLYRVANGARTEVASGTNGFIGSDDWLSYSPAPAGDYVLEVVNFAATGPFTGGAFVHAPTGQFGIPAQQESWTLACERNGKVMTTRQVSVDRGQTVDVGKACNPGEPASGTVASGSR